MSTFNDTSYGTHQANSALEPFRLTLLNSSGKLAYTTAGSAWTGVTADRAVSANDYVRIKYRSGTGTLRVTVDGAVTRGGALYTAASGKASATVSGSIIGYCLQTATADGDEVEMLPV